MSFTKENIMFPIGLNTLSFTTMLYNKQKEQIKKELLQELEINIRQQIKKDLEIYIHQVKKDVYQDVYQHLDKKYKELYEDSFIHISEN